MVGFEINKHNDLTDKDVAGNHAKLIPLSDGTTAIQITKADGTKVIISIDTTNERVGIGTTTPTEALHLKDGFLQEIESNPVLAGSLIDSTNMDGARSVYVSGKYAYVAGNNSDSIAIIDISDPTTPVLTGSLIDSTNMNRARSVYVSGKYAYVASFNSNSIAIIDIHGTELTSAAIGNIQTNSIDVLGNIQATDLSLKGGLNVSGNGVIGGDFAVGGDSSFVGNVGIGVTVPTAVVHLKAGTATAGTAPIKFINGSLLTTPETGTIEFANNKFYITNEATQKAIDRTSDVVVATVTVENTITETTVYTAAMAANSLCAGNIFKLHASGIIQNDGAAATEEVILRIKVGGVTVATLNPRTKAITADSHWHIDANATQRTIGASGSRAIHVDLSIETDCGAVTEEVVSVATIDTTVNMDVTITAEWASADANNTISLYQGYMEYKN